MSERHKNIIDKLEFDNRCTLYSWKHTGVVMAYKAGVDIKVYKDNAGTVAST
jgi:hypothetical protein